MWWYRERGSKWHFTCINTGSVCFSPGLSLQKLINIKGEILVGVWVCQLDL